jgi:hypothetical protein
LKQFLLIYRRSSQELIACEDLGTDPSTAAARRREAERRVTKDPEVEVVVLAAPSFAALRRTHARYFKTVSELTAQLLEALPSGETAMSPLPPKQTA